MELFYVSLVFSFVVMVGLLAFHFYHSHSLSRLVDRKIKNFQQEVLRSDMMSFYREMESYAALLERRINEYRVLAKQLDEKFSHHITKDEEENTTEKKSLESNAPNMNEDKKRQPTKVTNKATNKATNKKTEAAKISASETQPKTKAVENRKDETEKKTQAKPQRKAKNVAAKKSASKAKPQASKNSNDEETSASSNKKQLEHNEESLSVKKSASKAKPQASKNSNDEETSASSNKKQLEHNEESLSAKKSASKAKPQASKNSNDEETSASSNKKQLENNEESLSAKKSASKAKPQASKNSNDEETSASSNKKELENNEESLSAKKSASKAKPQASKNSNDEETSASSNKKELEHNEESLSVKKSASKAKPQASKNSNDEETSASSNKKELEHNEESLSVKKSASKAKPQASKNSNDEETSASLNKKQEESANKETAEELPTLEESLHDMQEQTLQINKKQNSSIKNLQEKIIELAKETEEDIEKEKFLDEAFSQLTQEQELNQLLWSDWRSEPQKNIKEVKAVELASPQISDQDVKEEAKNLVTQETIMKEKTSKKEKKIFNIMRNVGKAIRPILLKEKDAMAEQNVAKESLDNSQVLSSSAKATEGQTSLITSEEDSVDFSFLQQLQPKLAGEDLKEQVIAIAPSKREQALNKAKDAFLPQEKSVTPDKISIPENFDYRKTQTYRMLEEMNQKQKREQSSKVEIIRPTTDSEKLKKFTKEVFSQSEDQDPKTEKHATNHLIEKKVSPTEFSHLIQNLQAGQKRADSLSQLIASGFTLSEIENLSGVSYSELNLIRSLYNL